MFKYFVATLVSDPAKDEFRIIVGNINGSSYNLNLRVTGPEGKTWFSYSPVPIESMDTQILHYSGWDGENLVIEVDHNGDGSIDHTYNLTNQAKVIYLPVIGK